MHENFDAALIQLSAAEIAEIADASSKIAVQGTRYSAAALEQLAKS
jgi:hypothetical protein